MSSSPATLAELIRPTLVMIGDDASVAQALQVARAHQLHHLPVLRGSTLAGLMCTCDVRDALPESRVASWMSAPPVTLDASASLEAAARTMQDQQVGSVIVTIDGQPRGIVTRGDLLRVKPSTEDILTGGRCECCGLTRHLTTAGDGRTFCIYCLDEPVDTERSVPAPERPAGARAPLFEMLESHPLASLIGEHRLIGALAEALSGFAECVASESTPHTRADLAAFARVFRDLGDYVHHEKEETVLLPLLVHLGFDWEGGPLAEVRQDHCQERYLIDVLCQAAEREGEWNPDERRRIASTASALAEFQRAHLLLENTKLFPAVTERMSSAELRLLAAELRTFDLRVEQYLPRATLTELAQDLIRRYLAPARAARVLGTHGLGSAMSD
jgi:hemerythrin-like domain-containing protein